MKAKTHAVTINGTKRLVMALTKAGAVRDAVDEMAEELRKNAHVAIATGEEIYLAGKNGEPILNHDRFKNAVDPNQMPLTGVPETE